MAVPTFVDRVRLHVAAGRGGHRDRRAQRERRHGRARGRRVLARLRLAGPHLRRHDAAVLGAHQRRDRRRAAWDLYRYFAHYLGRFGCEKVRFGGCAAVVVTVRQAGGAGRGNSSSSSSKADMT